MKKDVQQYFIVQQKQYNEMLKLADKVNENGTKITETVGVAKLVKSLRNGEYQLLY